MNLCRATESRWKRNCSSLSSTETEVILWPKSFKSFSPFADWTKVSKAIGWNMYDPDNAAYLAWTPPYKLRRQLMTQKPKCIVFTPKQVFGPRTAKSQPIWIKFCTHLLLYGIHLWADLDRDRHVGGSRLNQNDYHHDNYQIA